MKDVRTLSGGMKLDDNPLVMKPEDYSYARNFRNNNKNDGGKSGNVKKASGVFLGNLDDVAIGGVYSSEFDKTIVFVYNPDPSYNKIVAIDDSFLGSGGFYGDVICVGSQLNFSLDRDVQCKVVEGMLIWSDDGGLKIIDIQRGINTCLYRGFNGAGAATHAIFPYSVWNGTGAWSTRVVYNGKVYLFIGSSFHGTPDDYPLDYSELYDYEGAYYKVNSDVLNLVALPPTSAPIPTYDTDVTFNQNNLRGKQFKFAYRYEYLDGRISVWSPWSVVPEPVGEEMVDGEEVGNTSRNIINLSMYVNYTHIKRVHIGVLEKDAVTVKVIDKLDVYDSTGDYKMYNNSKLLSNFVYKSFYNNETYVTESLTDFYKSYHVIPLQANNMEVIDDGRLVLGDITDGFDLPTTDVDITVESEEVAAVYGGASTQNLLTDKQTVTTSYEYPSGYGTYLSSSHDHYRFSGGYKKDGVIKFTAKLYNYATLLADIDFSYYYQHNNNLTDSQNLTELIKGLSREIRSKVMMVIPSAVHEDIDANYFKVWYNYAIGDTDADDKLLVSYPSEKCWTNIIQDSFVTVTDLPKRIYVMRDAKYASTWYKLTISEFTYKTAIQKFKTLKSISGYDLGIVYYDNALRNSGVVKLGKLNTNGIGNIVVNATNQNYKRQYFKAAINHLPPSGATKYSFVVTGNTSISDYLQIHLKTATSVGADDYFEVDLSVSVTDMIANNGKCILQTWVFEKGDRIRYLASKNGVGDYNFEETFDTEIISQDASTGKLKFRDVATIATLPAGCVLEIYRPRKGVDEDYNVYFEIGGMMNIVSGYHRGNKQNQTSSQPAIININYGDTWIKERFGTLNDIYVVESEHYSDYYDSDFISNGRPQFYLPDMKRSNEISEFRYGGKLLPDSNVNNIADFESSGINVLSKEFGRINGLVSKGYTLIIIQDKKIVSFYVGKDILTKADGSSELVAQNNVIGGMRKSDYDYGTSHNSSIIRVNTHTFFFDSVNSCFVRHADNGSFPISDYGVNSFAKNITTQYKRCLRKGRKFRIYGASDIYNNEVVWIVVYDANSTGAENMVTESVSFNYMENKWVSFWDYYSGTDLPTFASNYRDRLLFFVVSYALFTEMWPHDAYLPLTVEVVSNQEPLQNKVFNYVAIESNLEMNNSSYDAVQVDGGLMKTNIPLLKKKENIWYADFRRDSLTPMSGSTIDKVRNGRRLRGKYLSLNVSNDSTSKVEIDSIIIDSTISNRL